MTSTALANPGDDLFTLITSDKMQRALSRALPKHIQPERMLRIILTTLRANPTLGKSHQGSVVASLLQLAQLGLEPNTPLGLAYLVPYYNKKRSEYVCTPIVGYKGIIDLAYRSGHVVRLGAKVVREGDDFYYEDSFEPIFRHVKKAPLTARLTHAWCFGKLVARGDNNDDGRFLEVLDRADVEARKARSQSATTGPWKTDEAAMWRKTAVRAAAWQLPQSAEMQRVEALSQVDDGRAGLADALDGQVLEMVADQRLELPEPDEPPAEPAAGVSSFFAQQGEPEQQ